MRISTKLKQAIKDSNLKNYEIANRAGLHFSTLSQLLNGIAPIRENDDRVIAIGKVVGISAENCFE